MSNKDLFQNIADDDYFLIVGFGVTGKALASFFEQKNFRYYVFEQNPITDWEGECYQGQISAEKAQNLLIKKSLKLVFPSPGVALTHPIIRSAREQKIPIIGELELASFYLKGDFIAVTGTNGKSTTVRLINALLKDANIKNGLKGNIGSPLITAVNEPPKPYYVIEESSYQLELIGSLRHKMAICLNVTADHLDRYTDINEYAAAKACIYKNSRADDYFIFNHDDPLCLKMSWDSPAKSIPFSLVNQFDEGAFVDGQTMVIRLKGTEYKFDMKKCSLKGLHNVENMLACLIAVLLVQNDQNAVESYKKTLQSFVPLPHRLEKFHVHRGVAYYDDSKATNINAVIMALASFEGKIILIAGGKDKRCDFSPLKGIVQNKVKKLILMGEAKNTMYDVLKNGTDINLVETMKEAVQTAREHAHDGDVVLLSPACSSFDQYKDYQERGNDFQQLVKKYCV